MDRFTGDAAVNERLELARGLACRVGRDALEFREVRGRDALGTKIKSLQDFVTEADLNAEKTIRSELAHHFPQIPTTLIQKTLSAWQLKGDAMALRQRLAYWEVLRANMHTKFRLF